MKSRQLGHLGIGADTGDPGFQLLDFLLFRGQRFALRSDALALLLNLIDPEVQGRLADAE